MFCQWTGINATPGKAIGERGEAPQCAISYVSVLVLKEKERKGFNAGGESGVVWFYFGAEARDYDHGRVECVLVNERTGIADE
jgi:hypothetical protein